TGADDLHAVGVGEDGLEVGMAVVLTFYPGRWRAAALDLDRAAVIHVEGPLGDVVVVDAPVGHLAAGIRIPPAELVVAVGEDLTGRLTPRRSLAAALHLDEAIRHLRRLAEPEVRGPIRWGFEAGDKGRCRAVG